MRPYKIRRSEVINALEDLLDAIPKDTSDSFRWPNELTVAVRDANKLLDEFWGE